MRILPALVLLLIASNSQAEEAMTANTLRLSPDQKSPAATIADMEWYAGRWTGSGLGGVNEEVWSPPRAGTMMGMYRMLKDGKPVFYELLLIAEENGSLAIKLKHFHADLRGWEERDASVRFPLVAKRDGRIYFDGMTFERIGADRVKVYLAVEQKDGKVHEETFEYSRTKP
jgi:Domain of unknown function (DUF6265)